MKSRFLVHLVPILGMILILSQVHCLLVPNDTETGARVANKRPTVNITGGAASPDPKGVDYKVQFQWSGADEDGVVSLYRWAVDDTISESAWHDTTGFNATIRFTATTARPDSSGECFDWHTFYIRAIDNEFSISPAERRYFNASTIAPATKITKPKLAGSGTELQRTFFVRWEGEDLDSSRPDRKPIFYEYKLVYVADFESTRVVLSKLATANNILLDTLRVGDRTRWIRVPESVREAELRELQPSGVDVRQYAFAVRAIDEAKAVEPSLDIGRNVIIFGIQASQSRPSVKVFEQSLGTHIFPRDGETWENIVAFVGRPYRFKWTGDASAYGSEPGNVNYALDIPDPEDESLQDANGIGGWIGWGTWPGNQVPFVFTKDQAGSTHIFYVLMRDISNTKESTRICKIKLKVIDFSFSRFALLVDDAYLNEGIKDRPHDLFLNNTVLKQIYQFGDVDTFSTFGPGDKKSVSERLPDEMLVQYQHIIWNLNYSGGRLAGLYKTEVTGNRGVSSFLSAGGRLFICGAPVYGACIGQVSNYPYPPPSADDPTREREKLYYNLLYIRNTVYGAQGNNLVCDGETGGLVEARSYDPNYPDLRLDTRKQNPDARDPYEIGKYKGGIKSWEGFKLGTVGDAIIPMAGLDTLYIAQTFNKSLSTACASAIGPGQGAVCGWRYESTHADTLAHRQHGRVIIFNFQTYYFQSNRLTDAGTSAINWLVTGRDR